MWTPACEDVVGPYGGDLAGDALLTAHLVDRSMSECRKMHSDIWQFRWREKTADGKKIYRRRQIGTIDQIPDIEAARKVASLLVPDLNARLEKSKSGSLTIAQLCSHFEQCELCPANTWRSYSTKNINKVYLKRWIIPKWSERLLSGITTIEVESWLRSLPNARSTCGKIRNVMSVLTKRNAREPHVRRYCTSIAETIASPLVGLNSRITMPSLAFTSKCC